MKVVVLPGLDGTGRMLSAFARKLGDALVIAYPGDRVLSYLDLADYVAARLPREPFVLVAESFSGPVGALVAASRPEGLAGIVFAASFVRAPRRLPAPLIGLLRHLPFRSPALLGLAGPFTSGGWGGAGLGEAVAQVDCAVLSGRLQQVLRVNCESAFARIDRPMLYLRPRQDRLVPSAAARTMARLNPRLAVREIEGPHFILQTRPEDSAQIVGDFATGLAG